MTKIATTHQFDWNLVKHGLEKIPLLKRKIDFLREEVKFEEAKVRGTDRAVFYLPDGKVVLKVARHVGYPIGANQREVEQFNKSVKDDSWFDVLAEVYEHSGPDFSWLTMERVQTFAEPEDLNKALSDITGRQVDIQLIKQALRGFLSKETPGAKETYSNPWFKNLRKFVNLYEVSTTDLWEGNWGQRISSPGREVVMIDYGG